MNRVATLTAWVVSSLLWLGLPPAALAQARENLFAEFGAGPAAFDSTPPSQFGNDATLSIAELTFGGWLNPRWQIGVVFASTGSNVTGLATPQWFLGFASYYPRATSGFHVRGGVGAAAAMLDIVDEFGETAEADLGRGFSLMAGVGWDVHLWRRLWLTPAVNFRHGRPGDLVLGGRTSVTGWRYNMVDLTVGIRFD